jgi:hypothetical protein
VERSRRQVVEHAHAVTALEELIDEVGTEEAGAAGDEHITHGCRLS